MKAQGLLITVIIIFNGACKPISTAPATVPATTTAPPTAPATNQISSAPITANAATKPAASSVDAKGNISEFSAASQGVIVDTENPADPTGLRVITQSDPAGVLVTLEWQESHDNVTAAPNMTYYACSSTNGADISTLATCLSSATPAELPSIKGRASIQLRKSAAEATGVMSFRVIAQDEAGNKSISNILLAQFVTPNLSPAD
jgi:hypothetical protein